MRVAVIGVGYLGKHHARILSALDGVELVAVVDTNRARAEEIAAANRTRACFDARELAGQVDAVTVAVPTAIHRDIAMPFLDAGIPVLVEKPIAASVAEADALIAAAARTNTLLAVGHTERFNPAVEAARPLLGDPRFIEVHRLGTFPERSLDIDVVFDLMIHDLDIVLSLVRSEVETIEAVGVPVLTGRVDIANARLRFANGCIANLTASRISRDRVRKIRFFQPAAYVSIDYAAKKVEVWRLKPGAPGAMPSIDGGEMQVPDEEPLKRELSDFVQAIAARRAPLVTGDDGRRALALAAAITDKMAAQLYSDLTDFLSDLDKRRLLTRITEPVSPDLEIAAVTDRACKTAGGGPALLFEKPTGFDIPVAANVFGSLERMCLALGVKKLDDLGEEIDKLMTPPMPGGMLDALKMLPMVSRLSDLMPKTVRDAPCQEIVQKDGSLDSLPILKCWPEDGGRFITLPLVFTRDPETGMRNIGTYRMQVFDGRTTGMHWQRHKGGAQHHRVAERLGKRLEVAVALSPEPVLSYCATAPMPEGLDELLLGGFLARRRIEMVKCVTVNLEVPASSHIVLEGYVDPGERRREGPFGDHTGFYSQPDDYPVFHLTCLTRRKRPTYLTTIVGIPPMEDFYLGMASERIFLPLIKKTVPEIVDMHFPAEGIFHNLVIVSVDKRYPGHARKIMHAFWGLGQLMFSKTIVVVDKEVNVHDLSEVAWIVGTHMDPLRDIQMTKGPVDDLDDAADLPAYGGKMGIDATRKWASEGYTRSWPTRIRTTEAAGKRAAEIWARLR